MFCLVRVLCVLAFVCQQRMKNNLSSIIVGFVSHIIPQMHSTSTQLCTAYLILASFCSTNLACQNICDEYFARLLIVVLSVYVIPISKRCLKCVAFLLVHIICQNVIQTLNSMGYVVSTSFKTSAPLIFAFAPHNCNILDFGNFLKLERERGGERAYQSKPKINMTKNFINLIKFTSLLKSIFLEDVHGSCFVHYFHKAFT